MNIETVALLLLMALFAHHSGAQSDGGLQVTLTRGDVQNAMTEKERRLFSEQRLKMKKNKASQAKLADDPDSVSVLEARYSELETEFEDTFGAYRGLRGKTVTLFGEPPPTTEEVIGIVVGGVRSGTGGTLFPFWVRDEETGAIVGSDSKPELSEESVAEAELDAGDKPATGFGPPVSGGDMIIQSNDKRCGLTPPRPVGDGWDYARNGEPQWCCGNPIFGVDQCWWEGTR